jgi:hypothetical protein
MERVDDRAIRMDTVRYLEPQFEHPLFELDDRLRINLFGLIGLRWILKEDHRRPIFERTFE